MRSEAAAVSSPRSLPPALAGALARLLVEWDQDGRSGRLWSRDAALWSGADEARWLGWLDIVERQRAALQTLRRFADEVKGARYQHLLLLGMGGSSLCPEVLRLTFGRVQGFPELSVLDSTDPAQIRALEEKLDLEKTLFIVASKSGSTIEPNLFMRYFIARARAAAGEGATRQFIAVTDPGSQLEAFARAEKFAHVFHGEPSIGGRYSALSNFGLVPAAAMGLNLERLLARAADMVRVCGPDVAAGENPGVALGAAIGAAHNQGRDKLTLVCSPGIASLGAWIEQLVAESTGKRGKGVIPVDREPPGPSEVYGEDRLFVYLRLASAPDAEQDAAIERLARAEQPIVRIDVGEIYDLGAEFFRWEMATAVAGAVIGVNPFDQPDVEAAKVAARGYTRAYEETGALPVETALMQDKDCALYADPGLTVGADKQSAGEILRAHLGRLRANDYFSICAFIEMSARNESILQAIRERVRDRRRVATCLGFGPRFLHSTGQAHKGGPNSGVFLQITAEDARDVSVPDQRASFGVVKAAQAGGDFKVLAARGRRILRVHLRGDVGRGLERLARWIDTAL